RGHQISLRKSIHVFDANKRSADVPVEELLAKYGDQKDVGKRVALLERLTPSHDPRVAVALAEASADGSLKMRVTGTYHLLDHYVGLAVSGGTESHMLAVARWWRMNEKAVRKQASAPMVRPLREADLEVIDGRFSVRPDKQLLTIEGQWLALW